MYRTYTVDIVDGKRVVVSQGNMRVQTYDGPFVGTILGFDSALNFIYEHYRRYLVCFTMVPLPNGDRFYLTTLPLPENGVESPPEDPGSVTTIQRG